MKGVIIRTFSHCVGNDIYPTRFESSEKTVDIPEDAAAVGVRNGWFVADEKPVLSASSEEPLKKRGRPKKEF